MNNNLSSFFTELEHLFRKHNISISHEDKFGAFIIEDYNEKNMHWLKDAIINKEE